WWYNGTATRAAPSRTTSQDFQAGRLGGTTGRRRGRHQAVRRAKPSKPSKPGGLVVQERSGGGCGGRSRGAFQAGWLGGTREKRGAAVVAVLARLVLSHRETL